jgi:hypothetical protein
VCLFFFFLRALGKKNSGSEEQEALRWDTEEVGETPSLEIFKNRAAIWDDLDMASTKSGGWDGAEAVRSPISP